MHYGMVPYRPPSRDYSGWLVDAALWLLAPGVAATKWVADKVRGVTTVGTLTATAPAAPKKDSDTKSAVPSYTTQVSADYLKEEIKTAAGGRILVWRYSTFPLTAKALRFLTDEYESAERRYADSAKAGKDVWGIGGAEQTRGWDAAREHYAKGVAHLESALGVRGTSAGGPSVAGIKKQLQQGIILPGVQGWSPMIPGAVITVPGPKARKAARDAQAAAAAGAGGGVTTETTILGMSPTTLLLAGGGILAAYLLLSGKKKSKPSSRFTGI